MNVTGANSVWNVNGTPGAVSVLLGRHGSTGTLNISNNGAVNTAGDIVVGETNATGILTVASGGKLTTGRDAYIARFVGSNGTATVTGAGSRWDITRGLFIGNTGIGELTISNNATVSVGTSTYLTNPSGQGTLNITSGGALETVSLQRSNNPAQVNFDGGTLRAKADNAAFITGFIGTQLNLAAGGLTIDTAGFDVATASPFTGSGGLATTGGGELTLTGASTPGGASIANGALRLAAGGSITTTGTTTVGENATLTVTGAGSALRTGPLSLGTVAGGAVTVMSRTAD